MKTPLAFILALSTLWLLPISATADPDNLPLCDVQVTFRSGLPPLIDPKIIGEDGETCTTRVLAQPGSSGQFERQVYLYQQPTDFNLSMYSENLPPDQALHVVGIAEAGIEFDLFLITDVQGDITQLFSCRQQSQCTITPVSQIAGQNPEVTGTELIIRILAGKPGGPELIQVLVTPETILLEQTLTSSVTLSYGILSETLFATAADLVFVADAFYLQ